MRRRIEIGLPAAALAAVLVIWTWLGIAAAAGGECRSYETEPLSARIFEALVLFAAATSLTGILVNLVALADSGRRTRAWRGLWVSLGAAGALVLGVFTALLLLVSTCGS
ncbi:MAG: hypothetical protein H0V68_12295 [Actinobacteria bacterium]|nr:hypothetical protein [Actinomycetota bacterium]